MSLFILEHAHWYCIDGAKAVVSKAASMNKSLYLTPPCAMGKENKTKQNKAA